MLGRADAAADGGPPDRHQPQGAAEGHRVGRPHHQRGPVRWVLRNLPVRKHWQRDNVHLELHDGKSSPNHFAARRAAWPMHVPSATLGPAICSSPAPTLRRSCCHHALYQTTVNPHNWLTYETLAADGLHCMRKLLGILMSPRQNKRLFTWLGSSEAREASILVSRRQSIRAFMLLGSWSCLKHRRHMAP